MEHRNISGINLVGTLVHEVLDGDQERYFVDQNVVLLMEDAYKKSGKPTKWDKIQMIALLIDKGLVAVSDTADSMLKYWSDVNMGEYQGSIGYWIAFSKKDKVLLQIKPSAKKWWQFWK
jgi:hypothetical protein